ncbi:hypothetical protein ACFYPK_32810 [Streptomyces halstedii]|uniref:hypothetical protein n=1 Tax=Streptomyces halstedii TaxID=1944 RepID=UPI00345F731B
MANPTPRRKRKAAPAAKTRSAGRVKAPTPPASVTAQATEPVALAVYPEADPVLADAADRAADLRDLAADDVARILADGELRATELLDRARTKAASITEAATAERSRLLAVAVTDADRVRTQAATTAAADAEQIRSAAEATAEQLLADARTEADTVTATAAGEADQVLADAKAVAEQLLAAARRQADEVAATAVAHAEQVRAQAAQAADQALADAESARTELLAGAERTAAETRTCATTDADQLLERARGEADRVRTEAERAAAELREDAAREREASRAEAARARTLAEEDTSRLRATAAEDAERLTRTAREEADRILAAARTRQYRDLEEAEQALAQARLREADADVTLKAADDVMAEAAARLGRANDPTERRLERKRLRLRARQERQETKDAQKAKARELRAASRAGKPTLTDRAKAFVKVNSERLLVVGPITAPMAVAWTGQAGFAQDILDWVVPFTILFAAAWELSTAFVGWMYHQARRGGDSGTLYRVSTWIFALGAAVMNFWHASGLPEEGSRVWDDKAQAWTEQITYWHFTPKAVAFATMSIVGMVLWELYASLIHRRKLREDGKVAKARPSIGAVRWIRYPAHSFTAWSLAITDARLTTLDQAWTAAGTQLADRRAVRTAKRADREAVRTGRALHRVVVPRVRTGDHGPASIPTVLTLTRTDRSGPHEPPAAVRPVRYDGHAVRTGPADHHAVHGPVRTAAATDRTGGPALALESGPADHAGADQQTGPGPDRTRRAVPATRTAPAQRGVTVRTATPEPGPRQTDRSGPEARPAPDTAPGPDRETEDGPDRTVIELTDLELTALDRLRTANETLNRSNIARAVRTEGGSIATDRAGQIAVALRQHVRL